MLVSGHTKAFLLVNKCLRSLLRFSTTSISMIVSKPLVGWEYKLFTYCGTKSRDRFKYLYFRHGSYPGKGSIQIINLPSAKFQFNLDSEVDQNFFFSNFF